MRVCVRVIKFVEIIVHDSLKEFALEIQEK